MCLTPARFLLLSGLLVGVAAPARGAEPVLVGLDAELGYAHGHSADAIRAGIQIALEEINAAGGEALSPANVFMARYAADGALIRWPAGAEPPSDG